MVFIHYNIKVYGRVQGVFYRKFVQQHARFLGLNGFVKNKFDGSVYIEVEGKKEIINEFIRLLKKGPDVARIDDILIEENTLLHFVGFDIKY